MVRLVPLGLGLLAGLALMTYVTAKGITPSEFMACSCEANVAFDHDLPMSHPVNRCAQEQAAEVSWASWISGQFSQSRFHYLDLLELLSRNSEDRSTAPHRS